ncbi:MULTISPECIES: DUF2567 domain-containing protein [unclassified Streptomyces]|uniref:DUF2567 domain-containing protein n=1 Tax=unclassified Streptomyces TaxID=2593676 RepID=UPI002E79526A|nr:MULTISPECIES: DUF2567 domain-containing protein [unclassified Streptomyces]MEE1765456.1 DUF2567 domain-containing protein [Streptomyces sp. SP18BB07]MEE1834285.1 DUF2567 domain-containing protein [Streptomyces sp. SP17KL33]
MTAPLTPPPPPHDQSPNDPWAPPPTSGGGGAEPWYGPEKPEKPAGPGLRTELIEAAVVTVVMTLLGGALLGVLWWWLAPHVPLVSDGSAVYFKDTEGEQAVGVDGTFTLLALGAGALSALVVFLLRRRGGVPLTVALLIGGLLGAVVAWRLGVWLGPGTDVAARAKEVGQGVTFSAPLKLAAKGALLAWPLAALLVHLGLTAMFGPRDPEPLESEPGFSGAS